MVSHRYFENSQNITKKYSHNISDYNKKLYNILH